LSLGSYYMARLNDPPIAPPVESIDALKRRFIRQNREIARVNSTQSLRIRNLEAEISRLLAENISIREQAINIAQESERWRAAYKATAEITSLKNRLEAKLQEVNTLVTELGELPAKTAKRKSGPRKSIIVVNNARSPAEKEWRNQQTIGGVLNAERAEQEGRLPAILEEKQYPRRTLDHAELQTPVDDLGNPLESPQLGPPPVAHFDVPETDDYNQNMDPEKSPQPQKQPQPIVPLSVNLENRKKRRTSALLQHIPKDEDPPIVLPESVSTLKAGAKRKLDASVLDDRRNTAIISADDFVFKKAERDVDAHGTRFVRPIRKTMQDAAAAPSPAKDVPAVRKILASKSTNSPSKARVRVSEKPFMQKDGSQDELKIPKRPDRSHDIPDIISQDWKQNNFDATSQHQLPPKTPFSNDILSPASTEPSARVQEMAITNSVEDVLNGSIGRGSRRARAAISYAEPSLRDKMRRPGKELVGALEGIDKRVREGSYGPSERAISEVPTPQIKHERLELPAEWTKLPRPNEEAPSPLRDKTSKSPDEANEQIPRKPSVKRRLSGKASLGITADYTADFTISDENELENAVRRLSIFDPPSSSPPSGRVSGGPYPDTIEVEPLKRAKSTSAVASKARRHSVAMNSAANGAGLSHARSVSDLSTRPSSRQSLVGAGSRPGSAASAGRPGSATGLSAQSGETRAGLKTSTSTSRFGSDASRGVGNESRKKPTVPVILETDMAGTRASSRRRSMMV
jgi:hypothetical protein